MKYVSFDGTRYRCYLSENGRDATYLGCFHEKPRQAIQHTSGTYASPLRASRDGSLASVPPLGRDADLSRESRGTGTPGF